MYLLGSQPDLTEGEKKHNSGVCMNIRSLDMAGVGWAGRPFTEGDAGVLNVMTVALAGSPPAAVLWFPFGCLCKCGIMSLIVFTWVEFKYLDLWGKVHSLPFQSSFG